MSTSADGWKTCPKCSFECNPQRDRCPRCRTVLPNVPDYSTEHVLTELRRRVAEAGSARNWCRNAGVSATQVSDILREKSKITPGIAAALGYRMVVRFQRHEN